MDIALFQYRLDGVMDPVNDIARDVLARATGPSAVQATPHAAPHQRTTARTPTAPPVETWFWRRYGLAFFGVMALIQAPFYVAVSIYIVATGKDEPLRYGEALTAAALGVGALMCARHWHRERQRRIAAAHKAPRPPTTP
jgi:hypothetical protein